MLLCELSTGQLDHLQWHQACLLPKVLQMQCAEVTIAPCLLHMLRSIIQLSSSALLIVKGLDPELPLLG